MKKKKKNTSTIHNRHLINFAKKKYTKNLNKNTGPHLNITKNHAPGCRKNQRGTL